MKKQWIKLWVICMCFKLRLIPEAVLATVMHIVCLALVFMALPFLPLIALVSAINRAPKTNWASIQKLTWLGRSR